MSKKDRSVLINLNGTPVRNITKGEHSDSLPGPGQPMASKNKLPTQIVDKIIEIDGQMEIQGKDLLDCAKKNPKWFYEKIFIKILPITIEFSAESSTYLKTTSTTSIR